jgi:hypothetical protein
VPVTLGLLWAVLLLAVVDIGSLLTAVVVSPVGMVAAASAIKAAETTGRTKPKSGSRTRRRPDAPRNLPRAMLPVFAVALAATPVMSIAAVAGGAAAIAALVIMTVLTVVTVAAFAASAPRRGTWASVPRIVVAVIGPAVACMAMVLARGQGVNEGVALIAAICAYDAGSFLMGNGRTALGGPAGVIFGWLSVAVVAVVVAAVLDPPFSGLRPWILFGLVALFATAGVTLANRAVKGVRLPALRRLDAMILAAPAWVVGVAVVLHR